MADGTFKTVPKLFQQLYTIHGCVGGVNGRVVPLIYALMTRKNTESYDTLFRQLNDLAVSINVNLCPKYIMTDFEIAPMKAFVREFPTAVSKGCLFHLGQSVYRRVQEYGLAAQYGSDVEFSLKIRQLLALAFLSSDEIEDAFFQIKRLPQNCSTGSKQHI